MKKFKAILVGAGQRGYAYANYAENHPDLLQIVGVAEPNIERRKYAVEKYNIPAENVFSDWTEILSLPKMADFAIICTQDDMHFGPACEAIRKHYNILLEKPISPTAKECMEIARLAEENKCQVIVCHVLRFTQFYKRVKKFILSGRLGEIMTMEHTEGVGNVHQSHSFVRGNWRNSVESSPMILAKSCHDMDLLAWLIDKPVSKIQSFGQLSYFNESHKPEGSPARCIDGCPYAVSCYYNAVNLYLKDENNLWFRTAATELPDPTNAEVENALHKGRYGRCVFSCDNDVVDHQTVNMQFEGGATATFTMAAFNKGGRTSRIMGTKGELFCNFEEGTLKFYDFHTGYEDIDIYEGTDASASGHGGGDENIMKDILDYWSGNYNGFSICDIRQSAVNHLIAFAAEKSRLDGTVVDMNEFTEEYNAPVATPALNKALDYYSNSDLLPVEEPVDSSSVAEAAMKALSETSAPAASKTDADKEKEAEKEDDKKSAEDVVLPKINRVGVPREAAQNETEAQAEVKSEIAKSEIAKSEIAKAEIAKSEIAKSEIAKSEIAKSEIAKSEIAKSEPVRPANKKLPYYLL